MNARMVTAGWFAILLVLLAVSAVSMVTAEVKNMGKEFVISAPDFRTASLSECDNAVNEAVTSYESIVESLLEQLERKDLATERKVYAIYLLGRFRAVRAVSELIEIIDFRATIVDPKTRVQRWGLYPAQEALSRIGSPSVAPVLHALGTEDNETRRKLMVMVLKECLGKDTGQYVLEKAGQSATGKGKTRYEKAASILSGWK